MAVLLGLALSWVALILAYYYRPGADPADREGGAQPLLWCLLPLIVVLAVIGALLISGWLTAVLVPDADSPLALLLRSLLLVLAVAVEGQLVRWAFLRLRRRLLRPHRRLR
ncbi:hypothetical protein EVJ50_11330 [Synechococcus sp. RSCCF101]|uniref:hypothetical protein n=1 Tax=Synechococcus sp. RSCCF101 TaxID=2511069 RepID=UPI00124515D7|nr:hypothetical protein [Synechococcus sp. RSCCF101]QEY32728.1 hypothetical protein EVJ50_11330 [Synechococcus sp. RSCCF101]